MGFHRGLGDEQVLGDLPVARAVGGQGGDPPFARGQRVRAGEGGAARAGAADVSEAELAQTELAQPELAQPELAQTELAEYCRGRLAAYETPVRWLITDAFPLTSTGKIRKDVLSAQLGDACYATPRP